MGILYKADSGILSTQGKNLPVFFWYLGGDEN